MAAPGKKIVTFNDISDLIIDEGYRQKQDFELKDKACSIGDIHSNLHITQSAHAEINNQPSNKLCRREIISKPSTAWVGDPNNTECAITGITNNKPTPPTITGYVYSDIRIKIHWENNPGTDDNKIIGYRVIFRKVGDPNWITEETEHLYWFSDTLEYDTSYETIVQAFDEDYEYSNDSNTFTLTTNTEVLTSNPTPPTSISLSADVFSIVISFSGWTAPEGFDRFKIVFYSEAGGGYEAEQIWYTDIDSGTEIGVLGDDTLYYFKVATIDDLGVVSEYSAISSISTYSYSYEYHVSIYAVNEEYDENDGSTWSWKKLNLDQPFRLYGYAVGENISGMTFEWRYPSGDNPTEIISTNSYIDFPAGRSSGTKVCTRTKGGVVSHRGVAGNVYNMKWVAENPLLHYYYNDSKLEVWCELPQDKYEYVYHGSKPKVDFAFSYRTTVNAFDEWQNIDTPDKNHTIFGGLADNHVYKIRVSIHYLHGKVIKTAWTEYTATT